jgi:hypothetical protein
MKDMGIPPTWCGIEFTFLLDTIILHQTAYRKHLVEHWRKHPAHPMIVTPGLSPIKDDALRYKADAPGHIEGGYGDFSGMTNWLLIIGADITPGSTLVGRGLGYVTPDPEDAAEHLPGSTHAHPDLGITFDRRTPPRRARPTHPCALMAQVDAHLRRCAAEFRRQQPGGGMGHGDRRPGLWSLSK